MAYAIAKHVRMSPRKLRRVANIIRGKNASQAQAVLKFMPHAAARVIEKVLKSAVANAKHNEKIESTLKISKARVDQAVTLKRWRAVSRGRGYSILKKSSHVTIEVQPTDHSHDHTHAHDHIHDHSHHGKIEGKKEKEIVVEKTGSKKQTTSGKKKQEDEKLEEKEIKKPKKVSKKKKEDK